MKKKPKIIIISIILLFVIVALVKLGIQQYHLNQLHFKISRSDVEFIGMEGHELTNEDDIKDIIKWYNSITHIKKPNGQALDESGISIHLTNGEVITLWPSPNNGYFSVFYKKGNNTSTIYYWGKQKELDELLQNVNTNSY